MLTPRTTWREPKLFSTLCTARNPGRRHSCGPVEPLPLPGFAARGGSLADSLPSCGRGRGLSALVGISLGNAALSGGRRRVTRNRWRVAHGARQHGERIIERGDVLARARKSPFAAFHGAPTEHAE